MKTRIILLILFVGLISASYGQKHLQRAKILQDSYEFSKAIELYEKELKNIEKLNITQKRDVLLGLGSCYLNVNDYEKAAEYYMMCLNTDMDNKELYYKIGIVFLGMCDYDNAIRAFEKAIESKTSTQLSPTCKNFQYDIDVDSDAYQRIEMAEKANKRENMIPNFQITNMRLFNTEFSEYGVLYTNGILFYASMKKEMMSTKTDKRTLQGYSNIYRSSFKKIENKHFETSEKSKYPTLDNSIRHSWSNPEALPYPFNSNKFNDGTMAVDFNNNTAYVMQCNGKNGDCNIVSIQFSDNFNGLSHEKINLCGDTYNIGHPCISKDGNTMYFVSDMPGGYGGTDIWVSHKTSKETWSQPQNLGPQINSACDEMFPSIYEDSLLIFSSSGHKGYGGLDLFYAYKHNDGSFNNAVNFGLPVNSGGDDFSMLYAKELKGGFLCSNRPGGMGSDDIYFYSGIPFRLSLTGTVTNHNNGQPISDAVIIMSVLNEFSDTLYSNSKGEFDIQMLPGKNYIFDVYKDGFSQNFKTIHAITDDFDNIFRLLPDKEYNADFALIPSKTGVAIEGIVTEVGDSKPLSNQPMVLVGQDGYFDHTTTDETGFYRFGDIQDNNNYILMMAGKGYWTRTKVLDIPKLNRPRTYSTETGYNLDFEAVKISTNEEIIIYNIYYEFDKANLLETSFSELDKIVNMLKENPNLTVEISAHTDERGSDAYNNSLSQRRAQSVVNYLTSKGINKNRLIAKGYGKTKPLFKNAETEEEHQLNRRTAFKVLNISDQSIELVVESVSHKIPQNTAGKVKYSSSEIASVNSSYTSNNMTNIQGNVIYKVQIAASKKAVDNDTQFQKALNAVPGIAITEEKHDDGWFRYFAGMYSKMDDAIELRNKLKEAGYSDCFISIYQK